MSNPITAPPSKHLALDEPGFAGKLTLLGSLLLSAVIFILGAWVIAYGDINLPPFPQFVLIHVSFVFLLDGITAFLLWGQFHFRRLPVYLLLGSGYFFNAMIMIPFLLTFPTITQTQGGIIGGSQSAIWLWLLWHLLFPAIVVTALLLQGASKDKQISESKLWPATITAITAVILLVGILTMAVTVGHSWLPELIDPTQTPALKTPYYWAGSTAFVVATLAMGLAWYFGRGKISLYLWLAVAMAAFLADIATGLGSHGRYTVGWYFGRIEAIVAASILLLVFLAEIMHLYQRLGITISQLGNANEQLLSMVEEKRRTETILAQKNLELDHMAKTDYLTKLHNRQAIEHHIKELIEAAQRYNRPFSIIMLDIDHFKRINDDHGHNAGDAVLRTLSGIMIHRVRATDTVGRWGGEEFLIVCAETAREPAVDLAESLRKLIATTSFELPFPITASFGVAEYKRDEQLESIVARVDQQLYIAKQAGRNQVAAA